MLSFALILCLGLATLAGCTREREPWSDTGSGVAVPTVTATPVPPTATPDATILPIFTPHVTVEPGADQIPAPALNPAGDLPPMPGNEELTPIPPTATPEPELFSYTVQPGDTLYSISRKFGVTVEAIKQYNQLADPNTLRSGQELTIPGEAPSGTQSGDGYVHVVQRGETLFGIAQQYGVPLNELAAANGITNPRALRVGQRLVIPNVAAAGTPNSDVRVHIVQPGETLTAIAAKYGVTPAAIVQANNLADPNKLVSGSKLVIP